MTGKTVLAYALLAAAAVILPLALWQANLPIVANTYGQPYEPFELLGLSGCAAVLLIAVHELRRRRSQPAPASWPVLLWLLVNLVYLTLISEQSIKMWDWGCYEGAGRALNEGLNPYEGGCYYYPPLTAQVLAVAYRGAKGGASALGWETSRLFVWNLVFYLYQCGQWLLISGTFWLSYLFARNLKIPRVTAAALVSLLLVVNNPLFRTLKFDQVNLWVLDLVLLAVLMAQRYPAIAGFAVALAGHIKLYPLVLLGPWTLTRRWRAVAWALVGVLAVVLIQTRLATDWRLWMQYLASPFSDPKVAYFRNNSLQSVVGNTLTMAGSAAGIALDGSPIVNAARAVATLGVLVWFALRFHQRESAFGEETTPALQAVFRQYGHAADALALALMISPSAWEHHYVFALPLVLWSVAVFGATRPWPLGVSALLMFGVPTFDVFPLSYHRLAGLLLLLWVTSSPPSRVDEEAWSLDVRAVGLSVGGTTGGGEGA